MNIFSEMETDLQDGKTLILNIIRLSDFEPSALPISLTPGVLLTSLNFPYRRDAMMLFALVYAGAYWCFRKFLPSQPSQRHNLVPCYVLLLLRELIILFEIALPTAYLPFLLCMMTPRFSLFRTLTVLNCFLLFIYIMYGHTVFEGSVCWFVLTFYLAD